MRVAVFLAAFALASCAPRAHTPVVAPDTLVLVVLFVPAMERDGKTPVDQDKWTDEALAFFGRELGGATAFPRGKGVWRDDAHGGALVYEPSVVIHAYVSRGILDSKRAALETFGRRMAREANQSEVGIILGGDYVGCTP